MTQQFTLTVDRSHAAAFLQMVKKLDYKVEINPQNLSTQEPEEEMSEYKKEVFESIKRGLEEMRLIEQGKLKGRPARELLDEL